jgi:hypothetical protein
MKSTNAWERFLWDKLICVVGADPEARERLSIAFSGKGHHVVCLSDEAALFATTRN